MNSQTPQPRHTQGDQLILAIAALTAAVVANTAAVTRNNELLEDACEDCGDSDCDGDCEEPPRRKRR